jgi:WASH complex subunit CCDC53
MPAGRSQPSRVAASPTPSLSAVAEADADVQQLVQLVNRFVISSVQFLNRFAEECETKLIHTDEALQQLELQTQLLEHMLLSSGAMHGESDEENEGHIEEAEERDSDASSTLRRSDGCSDAAYSYDDASRGRSGHRRRRRRSHDSAGSVRRLLPPPSAHRGGHGSSDMSPPAAPNAYRKGPSQPPPGVARAVAAAQEEAAARAATLAIVGAPVLLPPPSSSEPPAPPPPLELRPGRLSMRTHPRLKGYFELLALRVPAAFVKAKMQADGYQGSWLDTPDAPAPATLSTVVRAFADEPD